VTEQSRPNILLVTTDQQRADTVGATSPGWLRTPHLDQLAREGVCFDRAYADNPLCVPSRIAVMSGQSVWQHRMLNNGLTSDALADTGTLPDLLRARGYQTVGIGKMHFGPERARHGFDETILPADYYREMRDAGHAAQPMRHGLGQNELYPSLATVPEAQTLTAWLCDQAALFVRERRDPTRPFFLWLSFSKPHPPLDPPEPYYSMYLDADIPGPAISDWSTDASSPAVVNWMRHKESYDQLDPSVVRAARAAYYGLVTQVDYNLGRVLASLQDQDMLREAFLLFTSDHGEFLGDHRLGNKILFHEPSARVPFIVRPPHSWTAARGTLSHALVTHADILPTLLEAAGAEPKEGVDGKSLLGIARGDAVAVRDQLAAVSAGADADSMDPWYLAVTDGRWKYIWYPEGGVEQLFDLETDPGELSDLSNDATAGVRTERERMRRALVDKCRADAPDLLDGGDLPTRPVIERGVRETRVHSWPGYHTETYALDVRH
jgi:arylsulfatase